MEQLGLTVLVPAGLLVAACLAAFVLHWVVYAIAERVTSRTTAVADTSVVRRTRRAALVVLLLLALQLALPATALQPPALDVVWHLLSVAQIAALTWLVIRAISVLDDVIVARYRIDVADNLRARQIHTQTRVISRSAMLVVGVIGFAAILMTFPRVRQFGTSLLASAGLAGLVVGLAARPTLSSLIAGIQLALTQPIRIDDVVIVEGEWGRIEEIRSTYVVVRLWDQRRLIVPLQHFIEQPFQNWTRTGSEILGTVELWADYTIPVESVRTELSRIVEAAPQWDRRVCVLQVTGASERAVQLRALLSASDAGKAWDLRCLVREKLIEFIQREHAESLPLTRARVVGGELAVQRTGRAANAGGILT